MTYPESLVTVYPYVPPETRDFRVKPLTLGTSGREPLEGMPLDRFWNGEPFIDQDRSPPQEWPYQHYIESNP